MGFVPEVRGIAPWQRPSSAPAPPQGVPGGSGQLGTPRKRPAHRAPSHRLGCSSQPPPKPPISPHLTVQVGLERRGQEACAEGEPESRAACAVARPRARAATGDGRGEAGHLQSCGQCARPEAEPARICAAAVLHRGHAPCRDEARIGRPRGWLAESGRSLGQSEAYSGTQRSPQSTSWPKSEPPCSRPRHAADALPARAAAHPADAQQGPRSLPGARTRGARPCAPQHVQSAGRRPEPPRPEPPRPEPPGASLRQPWRAPRAASMGGFRARSCVQVKHLLTC